MSVAVITTGERFVARIYKRLTTNPDQVWVNTYEMVARVGAADGITASRNALGALVDWEQRFHLQTVQFYRSVMSTWLPDSEPYNPYNLLVDDFDPVSGARVVGTNDPMALNVGLSVRRDVLAGRQGRAFYRGVLTEGDVIAPAGSYVLTPEARASLQSLVNAAGSETGGLNGALQGTGLALALLPGRTDGIQDERIYTEMTVVGVSIKALNNRHFDRRARPAPAPTP